MYLSKARIDMTVSAPQIGKSLTLAAWLLGGAWTDANASIRWPSWWVAPTYRQSVKGFERYIVRTARSAGVLRKYHETVPVRATLINGGVLEALSWDNAESLYSDTVARAALDEFGMLTDQGWAAISSRTTEPAMVGLGQIRMAGNVGEIGGTAERLYRQAQKGSPGWAARTWTWRERAAAAKCECGLNGDAMSLETADRHDELCERGLYLRDLALRKGTMSPNHFRQLYEAEWLDWSALPAYTFTRSWHVTEDVQEQRTLPLDLSCDFNVDPMCWIVGQHTARAAWALDEIVIEGGATTQAACAEFLRRYPGRKGQELQVYGDASGSARSTKSTRSDYEIIRQELATDWPRLRMMVPPGNGPVTDRLNAVNAMLLNGEGETRYYLHPRCEHLATDYARVALKPGTRDIDKTNKKLTHASDADGYRIVSLFPVAATGEASEVVAGMRQPGFDGGLATAQF